MKRGVAMKKTKPVNNDTLTCPKCGSHKFERVITGFVEINPFTMEKPYMPVLSYKLRYESEDGRDVLDMDKHFRCAKCRRVLRDKHRHKITTETGLLTYLKQQQ
jgi:hypothetical protein